MRFVEGGTLDEALQRFHEADRRPGRDPGERRLALRELLGRFVAVCNTVAYAHSRGVLHRDLKPGNVLLGDYGETLVVDWGLARPLAPAESERSAREQAPPPGAGEAEGGTRVGQVLGTPEYMSPEQAAGRWDALGPAADIYCLGATLYALLTGQPPFRGRGPEEALARAGRGEFAPPRQVKKEVPPALEAICLKAMALEPGRRYRTARELAGDVEHWLADDPVAAYREPWAARAGRWMRRHRPAVAGLAAALLASVLLGGLGTWYLAGQTVRQRQGIEAALEEVGRLQQQARWAEARVTLDQAAKRLEGGGPESLRGRLEQARRELALVADLDAIRLGRATWVEGHFDYAGADEEYAQAFQAAGLGAVGSDAATAAAWVSGTAVREALVAALDDWAVCTADKRRRGWLLEVARRADRDPWRDRARDPAAWEDGAALARLTGDDQAARQSPQLLVALSVRLRQSGGDAEGLLRRAQARHPADFWVNFKLGWALYERHKPAEAVGFYRAALTLRPATPAVYNNLGLALHAQGQLGEAAAAFRQAIALDRKFAYPHNGLGNVLQDQGKLPEAAAEFRQAIALAPEEVGAHNNLGTLLYAQGQGEEAAAEFRRARALDPKDARPHHNLGALLSRQGKEKEAAAEYRQAIALDPRYAQPHYGVGLILHAQGQREAAAGEFRRAIALDPNFAEPHSALGVFLYEQGKGEEAAAECRRAIVLNPRDAIAHYCLAKALRDQGKPEEAIAGYRQALRLKEDLAEAHYHLGRLLLRQGQLAAALAELKRGDELGSRRPGWPYPSKEWVRQCRRLLDLDARLQDIVAGKGRPAGALEQVEFAALCALKKRYAEAARFCADAFAAQATLADDLRTGHRYNAACWAALAAAEQGASTAREGGRLRRQALDWLRADLAAWGKGVSEGATPGRAAAEKALRHWQQDADLASVRDWAALARLPREERADWARLWADVADLLEEAGGQGTTRK
jgi:serine/threonine-protein kinase